MIKEKILLSLTGQGELIPTNEFLQAAEKFQLLDKGIESDADAVLLAVRSKDSKNYYVMGQVGSSLIQGEDMDRFLQSYWVGDNALCHKEEINDIADGLVEDLQKNGYAGMLLKSSLCESFRSFRKPIKSMAEIISQ